MARKNTSSSVVKPREPTSDKLNIGNEMRCLDLKDRGFYDSLSDEERQKFSPYLMIRWGSSVEGSRELQEFYVIATNERLNQHFFAVNTARHKKLQWLMATSVSPNLGVHRHSWIAPKKRDRTDSAKRKQLRELFPNRRDDEIDLLNEIVTQQEINDYVKKHGNSD
jgi:hypothetical protein